MAITINSPRSEHASAPQALQLWLSAFSRKTHVPVLLINLHKRTISALLHDLRIDHKRRQQRRRLRLTIIVADLVMAPRRLIPRLALVDHLYRRVIHRVEQRAFDDVADNRGAAVVVGKG